MKILYVLEYYYPHIGGVEILFQKLAEGAAKKGHQVRVVTIRLSGTQKKENINGVEVVRLEMPKMGQRYWFSFLSVFKLISLAKGYDLIHTTTYNAALPAWLVGTILNKKKIISVHEVWSKLWYSLSGMNYLSATLHRLFEWFILKLPFDYYFVISEYTRKNLLKIKSKKHNIKKIYLGVDVKLFDANRYKRNVVRNKLNLNKQFIYTYFGRPGWAKGLIYLIKAVPLIVEKIPESKLLLILSQDPLSRYLEIKKVINQLGVENNVMLLDSVIREDLPKYIIDSDCVVVPSLSEGFGFTVAESCSLDVPVIASQAGSIPEVISGKHILFEPASPKAIAQAVYSAFLVDYKYIKKKVFSWSETIEQYCAIYSYLNELKK